VRTLRKMTTDEEHDYIAQQQAEAESEEQWHEEND
jgi:hypothetical protein